MSTYRVNLVVVGNFSVEVEANSREEAIDAAYEQAPTENIYTGFEIGDWLLGSELFPESYKSEDDVEEIQ